MIGSMTGSRGRTVGIVAVTLSVLGVSACSLRTESSSTSSREPVRPVSMQEYGTRLTGAVDPLESALRKLAKVRTYKGLNDRVAAVEDAANQAAATLGQVAPPAELSAGH